MDKIQYKLQLLGYGPFDIPFKESWIIVGSGPSLDDFDFGMLDTTVGVIALNSVIQGIKSADVAILSHYESFWDSMIHLKKAGIVYLANPLHVGYRCIPCNAHDLLDFDTLAKVPSPEIRFFEKEMSLKRSLERSHTLFAQESISSAALHLLSRNNVETVSTVGIDGGLGHAVSVSAATSYNDESHSLQPVFSYDACYREFMETANKLNITVKQFQQQKETSHAMFQAC